MIFPRYFDKIKHDAKQHWHLKLKSEVYFCQYAKYTLTLPDIDQENKAKVRNEHKSGLKWPLFI